MLIKTKIDIITNGEDYMIIETTKGTFELVKNVKDAFNKEQFESKYVEDFFDKYDYIVGDISSELLRMKGFDGSSKGAKSFKTIPDYLYESCSYNCAYFILRRVKPEELNIEENNETIIEESTNVETEE